tara:strand:+ start:60110 stop:60463 length:354 start_codon:yes stop_codon:yes gene_type:complete
MNYNEFKQWLVDNNQPFTKQVDYISVANKEGLYRINALCVSLENGLSYLYDRILVTSRRNVLFYNDDQIVCCSNLKTEMPVSGTHHATISKLQSDLDRANKIIDNLSLLVDELRGGR